MLADKPKNFSKILEELGISSSHLTYHLENLGELVTKLEDGSYKLSSFGRAAVLTMKGVEETTTDVTVKKQAVFPLKWKTLFGVFLIAIIALSVIAYGQISTLNRLESEHEQMEADYDKLYTAHERLLRWGISTDRVINFLKDVIQLDLSKYQARLERNTMEYRADLGGVTEEVLTYSLIGQNSELGIDFRFRNQTLSRYRLDVLDGAPIYYTSQPTDIKEAARGLVERYQTYENITYIAPMKALLDAINDSEDTSVTIGDLQLDVTSEGKDVQFQWSYTTHGICYQAKGLTLNYDGGLLEMLTDGWFLYTVGSTAVNYTPEQAIQIALNNVDGFSWTYGSETVTDYTILEDDITVEMWPHYRESNLELIPYWYVVMPLDKIYAGNVDQISVGIWADTGKVTEYRTVTAS
jgi:hypothetical protein